MQLAATKNPKRAKIIFMLIVVVGESLEIH